MIPVSLRAGICAPFLSLCLFAAALAAPPLSTVQDFDRQAYLGRWHQIALYPNRFQAHCVGDTTADYRELPDGRLEVVNRCRTAQGFDEAMGIARPHRAYPANPAILEVRFAPAWLSLLPFVWGDYWVIATLGHYDAALVGSPDREYLWVLAREPRLSDADYAALVAIARREGFDPARLRRE